MKHVFVLSMENKDLAKEEIKSLTNKKEKKIFNRFLFIDTKQIDYTRLAFTKKVLQQIFICKFSELEDKIKKTNFQKYYEKDFCIRTFGEKQLEEKYLADLIWPKFKKPKVNLSTPKTLFNFYFIKNKVICGKVLHDTNNQFRERTLRKRPVAYSGTFSAKIAKVLVNLSKVKPKETLWDPFCGTGAILIEAKLMKTQIIGSDIEDRMLDAAKTNLKYFKLKAKIKKQDATTAKEKFNVIVTDLPYGRKTKLTKEKTQLYNDFLNNVYKQTKKGKRVVIVMPNNVNIKSKFKTVKTIRHYAHKTLTRKIIVLEK
ncbi:MAG: DNA methyltransferase [archaeon]